MEQSQKIKRSSKSKRSLTLNYRRPTVGGPPAEAPDLAQDRLLKSEGIDVKDFAYPVRKDVQVDKRDEEAL